MVSFHCWIQERMHGGVRTEMSTSFRDGYHARHTTVFLDFRKHASPMSTTLSKTTTLLVRWTLTSLGLDAPMEQLKRSAGPRKRRILPRTRPLARAVHTSRATPPKAQLCISPLTSTRVATVQEWITATRKRRCSRYFKRSKRRIA